MESIKSFISNHTVIRNVIIKGNWILGVSHKTSCIIAFIAIWVWVTQNDGHTMISDKFKSTVNLKVKGGFSTQYKAQDFISVYVKPYEYDNYNGQWDSIDYSFESPNEIGIMTNMVITANQTQKLCPEHPNYSGAVCNPKNNRCVGGTLSVHGTRTGRCVDADFPFRKYYNESWRNVSTCEIKGWCPVDRILPPLKGFKAVLLPTINTTLRIQSTVYFSDYKIIKNSLNYSTLNQNYLLTCRYHPDRDPLCATFALKDIINLTPNAGMSYEEMAIAGSVIVITIDWKCRIDGWLYKDYNSLFDCKPEYSFVRTDKYNYDDQTTYRFARYFNNGKMRTHYRSWQIRFVVDPKVTVREFHFYRLLTSLFAYNTVFIIIGYAFNKIITKIYYDKKWNKEIDVSHENCLRNDYHVINGDGPHLNESTFENESDSEANEENKPLVS